MTLQNKSDRTESILRHENQLEESPINAVVTTVAEATDQSPLEMEPLGEVIDPDALNALFSNSRDGSSSLRITFEYAGQVVTMTRDCIRVASSAET
jgi:hypothetical protein